MKCEIENVNSFVQFQINEKQMQKMRIKTNQNQNFISKMDDYKISK